MEESKDNLLLKDFKPRSMLVRSMNIPEKAKYPVIDAHNHLFGDVNPDEMVRVMDEVGVKVFINVTGNTHFIFTEKGYHAKPRDIGFFIDNYVSRYPERFSFFTMSNFANLEDEILIKDRDFSKRAVENLEKDVSRGASGLKVTKDLGLKFKDFRGKVIPVDDERLSPLWERAGKLKVPVLIHTSDPPAFFLPIDRFNEHYLTLSLAPDWSFYGSAYSHKELLDQRNRIIAGHPDTTFICPHVASYPEDLQYVTNLLDENPNVYIDLSARIDELGRQPYGARNFMIKYQDRIIFGTDMPVRVDIYRTYFRFLETDDEYFEYPDYVGRFGYHRWFIFGIFLPENVLKKIYSENAKRIIPGLTL